MKMVLHYLRFDWQHWRVLLVMLWISVLLHTACTWISEDLQYDPLNEAHAWGAGKALQWTLTVCRGLAATLVLIICHEVGRADSRVRGGTWLMTRPVRGRALVMARGGFILAGVVLPVVAGYGLMLAMMKFNAATVVKEVLHATAAVGSVASLMLVWSLVSTSLAGLVLGCLTVSCAGVTLFLMGMRLPEDWARFPAHPSIAVLLLTLPAAYGLARMNRRLSRQQWALDGFKMGALTAVTVALIPAAGRLIKEAFPGELERLAFADKTEWVFESDNSNSMRPSVFRDDLITVSVPLQDQPMPLGIDWCFAGITAISWRPDPTADWSEWREARGGLVAGTQKGLQGLSFHPGGFGSMKNGEFRLQAWLTLRRQKERKLPCENGAIATGDGWVYEIVERKNSEGARWLQAIFRQTAAPAEDMGRSYESRFRIAKFTSFFLRCEYVNVTWPADSRRLDEFPGPISLVTTRTEQTRKHVLHITGVNLTVPEPPEKPKPRREPPPPGKPKELSDEPFQEVIPAYPWPLSNQIP